MTDPADAFPEMFHPVAGGDQRIARIALADGIIAATALEELAMLAADVDASHLQITEDADLEIHGIDEHHVHAVVRRVTALDLGRNPDTAGPDSSGSDICRPDTLGWHAAADGTVLLVAMTADGRFSPDQARYAAAIGVPVRFTVRRHLQIAGLGAGVAEAVVRVLAPLGFSFDARDDAPD